MSVFLCRHWLYSLLWLSVLGCQRLNRDDEPLTIAKKWLMNRPWQICCQIISPAVSLPTHAHPITDLLTISAPCDRDDLLVFSAHGGWLITEGPSTCRSRSDSLIMTGNWQLTGRPDSLLLGTINREGDAYSYRILYLDSTLLIRRYEYPYQHRFYTITETLRVGET